MISCVRTTSSDLFPLSICVLSSFLGPVSSWLANHLLPCFVCQLCSGVIMMYRTLFGPRPAEHVCRRGWGWNPPLLPVLASMRLRMLRFLSSLSRRLGWKYHHQASTYPDFVLIDWSPIGCTALHIAILPLSWTPVLDCFVGVSRAASASSVHPDTTETF